MVDFRVADRDLFSWQYAVIDKSLTAPPVSPSEGDRHIVGSPATGTWSGHEGDIAELNESEWGFYAPAEGWRVDVLSLGVVYRYTGAAWVFAGGGLALARDVMTWVVNGPLVTGQNFDDLRVAIRPGRFRSVYLIVDERGRDGDIIVDVNKGTPGTPLTTQQNGTTMSTIYTTQANRPTLIGDNGNADENAIIKAAQPDLDSFLEGDVFGIDLDSITPMSVDLTVSLEVEYF